MRESYAGGARVPLFFRFVDFALAPGYVCRMNFSIGRARFSASLLAAALFVAGRLAGAPATLEISPPTLDLGVVAADGTVSAEFEVANRSDRTLRLSGSGPAETSVTIDPRSLPAGARAKVRVEIGTAHRTGPAKVEVRVATDDLADAPAIATVSFMVRPYLLVDPGYARYNFVQGGREGLIRETVFATDDAPFKIVGIDSPLPALTSTFRPANPQERLPDHVGSQWIVDLKLSRFAPIGSIGEEIAIRTDHPRQKTVLIPVSGFVRPMLAVTPPEAELGDLDPSRPVRARLLVKSFAENPVNVEGATTDVPGMTVEVEPIEKGRSYAVILKIPPGPPGSLVTGMVRISTDSSTQPVLEVPVRGRFLEKPVGTP